MPNQIISASQPLRLLYLTGYLLFLFLMNYLAFGNWLPLTTAQGLWFYSGAASLILGSLIVTPFFTSPANSISYLVAALIAIFAFAAKSSDLVDTTPRIVTISFCLLMLAICVLNIILKDSRNTFQRNVSEAGRILADSIGSPRFVYAIVIVYAMWEYHRTAPKELFIIGLSGIVIAAQRPLETFGNILSRIRQIWLPHDSSQIIGCMIAHQSPDILLVRQDTTQNISPGTCLLVADMHAPLKIGVTLGYCGRDEGLLLRALEIDVPNDHRKRLIDLSKSIPNGCASILSVAETDAFRNEVYLLKNLEGFVGIVASDSSTQQLYFEITQEKDIEQGRLVETFVGRQNVLYQVLDGLTKEKIVQQKNTYGFARGEAIQIGIWDEEKRKFKPCNWIPRLNAPVFLKSVEKPKENESAIGFFPSTSFDVHLKSINELVTHNTAILGILGVGKSMLGIELVERILKANIKVICLDLTNQYAAELAKLIDSSKSLAFFSRLDEIGKSGKTLCKQNQEEGGSRKIFSAEVLRMLTEFINDKDQHLLVLNPSYFEVWRQDSKIYQGQASMASLTPTEITQIISDSCIQVVQALGISDKARVCLVYEEAHTLIPEWTSVAAEGDKAATNGTARAILQGRKYGLGCLLVTQRTANVTKTILNQCNTIFAMRTFDDTGKEFLSNYIGSQYASKLSSLKERHAVFYGRASSCENPVIIRLNDRDDFVRVFRKQATVSVASSSPHVSSV